MAIFSPILCLYREIFMVIFSLHLCVNSDNFWWFVFNSDSSWEIIHFNWALLMFTPVLLSTILFCRGYKDQPILFKETPVFDILRYFVSFLFPKNLFCLFPTKKCTCIFICSLPSHDHYFTITLASPDHYLTVALPSPDHYLTLPSPDHYLTITFYLTITLPSYM